MAFSGASVGVLGGGQLGRMLLREGLALGLQFRILDPNPQAPCANLAHTFEQGPLDEEAAIRRVAAGADVLTIEIEQVGVEALEALEAEGLKVAPSPAIIRLIQDKLRQKQFYWEKGFPTAPFEAVGGLAEVRKKWGGQPKVYKAAQGGYDGRGVCVLKEEQDLAQAFDAPGLLEDWVPFEKELAVMVQRNASGQVATFPLVEMVFHPTANLVEYLFCPADVPEGLARQCHQLARDLAEQLRLEGTLAIELFQTAEGQVLINETAPRVHNSGHHSLQACNVSQFEQHLRAILDLPLARPQLLSPAAMVNILGAEDQEGPAAYEGLEAVLAQTDAFVELYGKAQTRPFRKMGHCVLLGQDRTEIENQARWIKTQLKAVPRK